jgi:hypothetical protein
MNNISTSALLVTITLVLLLSACSTASKHEPAPAAAPPIYEPKPDRN